MAEVLNAGCTASKVQGTNRCISCKSCVVAACCLWYFVVDSHDVAGLSVLHDVGLLKLLQWLQA
jgi:hypothetical protein